MSPIVRHVSFRLRVRLEDNLPFRHILTNESIRPAYRALAANEVVLTAGDGRGGPAGPDCSYRPVRLLGHRVLLPPGPASLARHTGAPLLPVFCVLGTGARYVVRIHKPIRVPRTADRDADLLCAMEQYVPLFDRYLRAHPDHWSLWEDVMAALG